MDSWQKNIGDKLSVFLDIKSIDGPEEVRIDINQKEAYVLLKALEDQQRYLNPLLVLKNGDTE